MEKVEAMASGPVSYDRLSELRAFDDTKTGVKGLVDAGVTAVPRIFHLPAAPQHHTSSSGSIPVIDLAAPSDAQVMAQLVKEAAETVGFFQVVNHGVPGELLDEMLASIKRFHEEAPETKRPYYSRDPARRVRYQSNFDLFQSPAANWRDTLFLEMAPTPPAPEEIPAACRGVVSEYARRVQRLGATLLELVSEALGLHPELHLDVGLVVASHYYPPCPEPHLTLGTSRHSDPSLLTVLLQDAVGGLQVLQRDSWVEVPPVPGALVVNIGDFLQLVSNDRLKSVEHRVVAMSGGPRVSVACFFRHAAGREYRPITCERPRYRSITVEEFLGYYMRKGLDGRSALQHFSLPPSPHPHY